jgi:hypothetical protein
MKMALSRMTHHGKESDGGILHYEDLFIRNPNWAPGLETLCLSFWVLSFHNCTVREINVTTYVIRVIHNFITIYHKICIKREGTGRRGTRRKQLSDDLKETRRYWKLKEGALVRTLWRTHFER